MFLAREWFSNADNTFPLWLAIDIDPAGGYGDTICAHNLAGVEIKPCPLGPAIDIPSDMADSTNLFSRS